MVVIDAGRSFNPYRDSFGDYLDYSGFKKNEWEPRSHALHVWHALQQRNAVTEEKRKSIESRFGARYSSLYTLPYYNAITSCIIDPMHCLFLTFLQHFNFTANIARKRISCHTEKSRFVQLPPRHWKNSLQNCFQFFWSKG